MFDHNPLYEPLNSDDKKTNYGSTRPTAYALPVESHSLRSDNQQNHQLWTDISNARRDRQLRTDIFDAINNPGSGEATNPERQRLRELVDRRLREDARFTLTTSIMGALLILYGLSQLIFFKNKTDASIVLAFIGGAILLAIRPLLVETNGVPGCQTAEAHIWAVVREEAEKNSSLDDSLGELHARLFSNLPSTNNTPGREPDNEPNNEPTSTV